MFDKIKWLKVLRKVCKDNVGYFLFVGCFFKFIEVEFFKSEDFL